MVEWLIIILLLVAGFYKIIALHNIKYLRKPYAK